MLNDEICKKRDELNKSIENNEDYDKIYKISVELDELIAKYYMQPNICKTSEKVAPKRKKKK
ncbi:MAG: aspartyl-phosphate phosphatase Spo0E family protein [Clostridia bacterium]|nr:aspartyl-phosphate phosphatase Spo0E family protein [Clostridia bacterium]